MAYLYRHIRLDKNEPFYVGIGSDSLGKYARANSIKLGRNPLHQNILNKTAVEVEIILDDLTWEEACEKEKEFIKLYGRIDLGTGILTNLTDGGEGTIGIIQSEKSNQLRSKALLGRIISHESREKNRKAKLGKTLTEADKEAKSKSRKLFYQTHVHHSKGKSSWNKGKPMSKETKDKLKASIAKNKLRKEGLFT